MKRTTSRRGATSSRQNSRAKSDMTQAAFSSLMTNNTRQATGHSAQNEEGIYKAIREALVEQYGEHTVYMGNMDAAVRPSISTCLYNFTKYGLTKSLIAINYEVGQLQFVYTFVLAGCGQTLDSYYINGVDAHRKEQAVRATADMVMDAKAKAVVSNNFAATPQIESDDKTDSYYPFAVLASSLSSEDEGVIKNHLDNAIDALDSMVRDNLSSDAVVPTLTDYLAHATPKLTLDFNPDFAAMNTSGFPVRSDCRAELKLDLRQNNGEGDRRGSRRQHTINNQSTTIATMSAYCNLNYFKDGIGEDGDKYYLPTVHITSMDTGTASPGIADLINATYLSTQIVKDSNWARLLEPSKLQQANKDINSIVSDLPLMYDQEGKEITGFDLNSRTEDFYDFIEAVVEDSPLVQLIVPRGEATTWAYQPLAVSALDEGVNQLLIDATDALTNNEFVKELALLGAENAFFFEEYVDQIHQGYWITPDGQHHDLATIDYLAIATYTEGTANMEDIREDWDATFLNEDEGGRDIGTRLNDRLAIMALYAGGESNIVVTGYADVYTYNPTVLLALSLAYANNGFKPKADDQARIHSRQRGNRHLQAIYETNGANYNSRRGSRRNVRNNRGGRNNGPRVVRAY